MQCGNYLWGVVVSIVLTACASAPTRFYTLAVPLQPTLSVVTPATATIFIDVAPVRMPERLARPQIVLRGDAARVDILEQERWATPFNNELRDALVSGVTNRLGAVNVMRGGGPSGAVAYRIAVELHQLDVVRGSQVAVQFGWIVTRSDSGHSVACRFNIVEPLTGMDVAGVVQGIQRAVAHAVDAIVIDVLSLRAGQGGSCAAAH